MRTAWLFVLLCVLPGLSENLAALDTPPERIISLAPSITRELYDLGAQDKLVGVTCYRPDLAGSKDVIGSLTKLNFEKIFSLGPDLILASKDSNTKRDIDKLRELGLQVTIFEGCESFSCMCTEFESLGSLMGKKRESMILLQDIQDQMQHIRSSIYGQKPLKVFWQIGSKPLVTINDKTFAGEYIRLAGCENIFADLNARYPRINIEEVITRNPDVIVVVTQMDSETGDVIWDNFYEINAVKNARIHTIPADIVCQPTPRMFLEGLKAVINCLYPGVL
jgi:iron complex transport system substrate-binding protein